jgi:hypothetical protein
VIPWRQRPPGYDEGGGTLTFFAVNRHGDESIDREATVLASARPGRRSSGDGERPFRGREHPRKSRKLGGKMKR